MIAGPRDGKEMVNRCVTAGCSNTPIDRVGSDVGGGVGD